MRANLDAAGGLPMAQSVAAALEPALGPLAAHDLVAEASAAAAADGSPLAAALASTERAARLRAAGVSAAQLEAALDPVGYLGAARYFTDSALAAYEDRQRALDA